MDNKKNCSVCGVQNEEDYRFCKNCGAPLEEASAAFTPNTSSQSFNPINNFQERRERLTSIDGVETEKLAAYVGKEKRDYYMPRFIGMTLTGHKSAFNWAIALLACVIGLPFAAAWFFYRRMPKIGFLICSASLILTALITVIYYDRTYTYIRDVLEAFAAGTALPTEATGASNEVISFLRLAINVALIGWLASYGNYYYLKSSVAKIKLLDSDGIEKSPELYEKAGKPAIGLAIAVPIIFNFISTAISMIPFFAVISEIDPSVLLSLVGVV